jgi:hypothetical protein
LAYLGLGFGFILSAVVGAKFANQVYLKVRLISNLITHPPYATSSWPPGTVASERQRCASQRSSLGHYSYPLVFCKYERAGGGKGI